ncbi:MAG: hypothetical protein PHN29_06415 [Endomicrobiaceae bacterium]|nr:hypothetical protein [Endomicrobiaceae bacterium]
MKFKITSLCALFIGLLFTAQNLYALKDGWQLELKKIALNVTSTEVQNAETYKAAGVSNARLTSDSQTLMQGTFNFAADYFAPKSFWSNTLLMEYGKTYLRPVGKDEITNENVDKILITTDYTYRLWNIKDFLGGFEAGPFVNIGYETEFTPQDNTPLKKIIRGMAGAKLFEGKYLKSLYAAGVGEADYTYEPESTKFALEAGFKLENPIREGLKVVSFGYYRNYLSESTERITDLQYELELDVRLDVMLYKNLSLAPFINYYAAEAKHFSGRGENLYTGLSLTYSTFFKKAKEIE